MIFFGINATVSNPSLKENTPFSDIFFVPEIYFNGKKKEFANGSILNLIVSSSLPEVVHHQNQCFYHFLPLQSYILQLYPEHKQCASMRLVLPYHILPRPSSLHQLQHLRHSIKVKNSWKLEMMLIYQQTAISHNRSCENFVDCLAKVHKIIYRLK